MVINYSQFEKIPHRCQKSRVYPQKQIDGLEMRLEHGQRRQPSAVKQLESKKKRFENQASIAGRPEAVQG